MSAAFDTSATGIEPCRKTQVRPRGYIADYRPQSRTVDLLNDVIGVLNEYRAHWPITGRQVYYRLVGAHSYPKTEEFYKKLCHHLANARRGKLIPFGAIRDDGISTVAVGHFDDEEHFKRHVRQLGENYKRNRLAAQDLHVEVWCEAAGMIMQLAAVAEEFSVQVYSSSGFDSLTAKKSLADRICDIGKPTVVLHLGDYDPSGEAMFKVIAEDVGAFVEADRTVATVTVDFFRVALTKEQVEFYDLPTAPAKASDTRSRSWSGETCQLEALAPDVIAGLLRSVIEAMLNPAQIARDVHQESLDRQQIARALPAPEARP